ncbi:MAG: peptidoglycan-binding protein [Gammaproteobacteria bacterium]
MNNRFLTLAIVAGALVGCGTTPADRTLSGAGLGAGAGAAIGAVTGAPAAGAAIGAVAGGLAGAVTSPGQLNAGDPPWRNGYGETAGDRGALIAWIQSRLQSLGYYRGPANGEANADTRAGIRAYQRDHGLLVDGKPSPALADYMYRGS